MTATLVWFAQAATAAEPPAGWAEIAQANPGLTLVIIGEEDRPLIEGWCDKVTVLPSETAMSEAIGRLDGLACAVLALGDASGWTLMPSSSCLLGGSEPPSDTPSEEDTGDEDDESTPPDKPQSPAGNDDGMIAFGLIYGAYAGSETGWLMGEASESSESGHRTQGLWPGLLGGGIVGLSTGLILDRSRAMSAQAEMLLFNASSHGLYYGLQVGRALIPPDAPGAEERIHASGLAGSMLGTGIAVAFGNSAAPVERQARFAAATGIGWVTATGISDLANLGLHREDTDSDGLPEMYSYDRRPRAAIAIGTAAAFGGLGTLGNRLESPGPAALGLSIGHGLWIGGFSPLLFSDQPDARQVTGGLRLGFGAGYASALLLGAAGEPDAGSVGLQVAGWAAASALGAGIPLSMAGEGPASTVVGPMLLSGIGGQVLGAVVAPHYQIDLEDGLLLGSLAAWTSYQAIGWGLYASYTTDEPRRPFGYALSAGGAGSLVTIAMTPLIDVEPAGSVMLLSSGGWGTWYGAWISNLSGLSQDETWLTTLVSGNGTLLGAGIAQGLGWRPDWGDVAAVDSGGLIGSAAGGLIGVIFLYNPDDWDPLILSTLTGSTLGLAGGGYLAARGKGSTFEAHLPRMKLHPSLSVTPLPTGNGRDGIYVRLDVKEGR